MRLVSYNGVFDVLYDNVILLIEEFGEAYAIKAIITENMPALIMGIYGSKERASQVLNELRGKYAIMDTSVFYFPE